MFRFNTEDSQRKKSSGVLPAAFQIDVDTVLGKLLAKLDAMEIKKKKDQNGEINLIYIERKNIHTCGLWGYIC